MDDVMIILGAIVLAAGIGLVFVPAGLIAAGVLLIAGGVFKARARAVSSS